MSKGSKYLEDSQEGRLQNIFEMSLEDFNKWKDVYIHW